MKIKTITCHNVYNYGATLQAYALQHFLEMQGNEVEIIDYAPAYHDPLNCWKIPNNSRVKKYADFFFPINWAYFIHWKIKLLRTVNKKRLEKFHVFDRTFLHLTSEKYVTYEQLKNTPPRADVYIAGSDQIWNYAGNTGLDPAFYLKFGDKKVRRISYAASFGLSEIKIDFKETIENLLGGFDAISVREKTGLKILDDLNIKDGYHVMDPVFLLNRNSWLNIACPMDVSAPYILVYDFFQNDEKIKKMTFFLSDRYGLKVVSVNDNGKLSYADLNICDASPQQFLWLIANAKFVVSNSFHATAFSIIMRKEFFVYPIPKHNNQSRMVDLLSLVGLQKQYDITVEDSELSITIDWDEVDLKLEKAITFSKQFINRFIS